MTLRPRASAIAVATVLGGSAASAGLAAVANWLLANGLGPVQFGLFSIAMALMTVLLEMGGPAIDTAIVRFASPLMAHSPQRAEAYLQAGFRLKLVVSCAMVLLLLASADVLARALFREPGIAPVLRWLALCLLVGNLSTMALARLQSQQKFLAHSLLRGASNALKVLLVGAALAWGVLSAQSAAIAWVLSFGLVCVLGAVLTRAGRARPLVLAGERPGLTLLRHARWAMLSGLLFALHLRSDMLLLGHYGSAEAVGSYAVAWNLMLLLDLVTSSILVAQMPAAAQATTPQALAALRRRTVSISLVVAVAMLPMYFLADELVGLLFPAYPQAVALFKVLFLASMVTLLVYPLNLEFYAQNQVGKITAAYAMLCVTSLGLGMVLVPAHGAMGAAVTTLVARVVGGLVILCLLSGGLRMPAQRQAA